MAERVEELTITYKEGDQTIVEELDKVVLSKGAWATILFKYHELDRRTQQMGSVKFGIHRYQKRNGVYRRQSKFTISSEAQARKIVDALGDWLG